MNKTMEMTNWQKKALELREKGVMWCDIQRELADELAEAFPDTTALQQKERVRTFVRRCVREGLFKGNTKATEPTEKKSVELKANGEMVFEGIIELMNTEAITPENIMKAHNIDPEKWEVVSMRTSAWETQRKNEPNSVLYASKIAVRPRDPQELTLEDVDEWFAKRKSNRKPFKPFKYDASKEILEINYTDLHVGLLAWRAECGADFDLKIIQKRFEASIADILERCHGRKFKLIRFITLGDILHVDNSKQTTTNGTFQQIDGRVPKIFDLAADMITSALEELLTLKTPVEYIYIAGNHDRDSGYYLAKTIETYFRKEPNITFDISPNPLKAKLYGSYLVGYCHGDMSPKNLGTWLMQNYRKEFGQSVYAEIHCGHLHSKTEDIVNGIKVVRLPALCESSYWEHQMGYKSERALICYVWNEKTGKRETWVTNF